MDQSNIDRKKEGELAWFFSVGLDRQWGGKKEKEKERKCEGFTVRNAMLLVRSMRKGRGTKEKNIIIIKKKKTLNIWREKKKRRRAMLDEVMGPFLNHNNHVPKLHGSKK